MHIHLETSTLLLQAEDKVKEQSLNISWIDPHEAIRTYNLTVVNSTNQLLAFILQKPYHIFTAPEGAPPCEVYNFSVTAAYIGATYTGAGCSDTTTVLSRMMPSLPNISRLESTLDYVLEKRSTSFVVKVSFEVSCHDFTVDFSPDPFFSFQCCMLKSCMEDLGTRPHNFSILQCMLFLPILCVASQLLYELPDNELHPGGE